MKKHYPPILNQLPYKLSPYKVLFENLHPPFIKGRGRVKTMDLYIETNIHPSVLLSPSSHFKGTFAIFP